MTTRRLKKTIKVSGKAAERSGFPSSPPPLTTLNPATGQPLAAGETVRIRGERGTFIYHSTGASPTTGEHWIWVVEADNKKFRAFRPDRIIGATKRGRKKEADMPTKTKAKAAAKAKTTKAPAQRGRPSAIVIPPEYSNEQLVKALKKNGRCKIPVALDPRRYRAWKAAKQVERETGRAYLGTSVEGEFVIGRVEIAKTATKSKTKKA